MNDHVHFFWGNEDEGTRGAVLTLSSRFSFDLWWVVGVSW